ncbi:MAG: DUF402 domain-containing protein [Candidatus Abyssubacteria bacterium]|nr:DUF402 domain-containing protein [Candidatus Abyssubacteria bacterium]
MSRKIVEIKRHVNKPTERYECDLVSREPGHLILRYVSDRKFASKRLGITFPPGCITIALYWETRPYVFWGIFSPDEKLLGYLVHICREVSISDDSVSYLDMLLDLWFFPDGRHIVLDEDEVEECFRSGLLSEDDKEYIEKSRETALAEFAVNAQRLTSLALRT